MEQHYAFIKNNRVFDLCVFAEKDEALADSVAQNLGYEDAVWVGENKPVLFSTWDGNTFTEPTKEDLIGLGVITPTPEEHQALIEGKALS